MPSVVDVCNLALDKLGQSPITSLSDGTKTANLCSRNWPLIRDQELRRHAWNFSIKRAVLAPSSTSPEWGFSYQHPLPVDFLRLVEVRDLKKGEYQVEGRNILTDETVLYIRYVAKMTDPNQYDSLFIDVVSTKLVHSLMENLNQHRLKKEDVLREYGDFLAEAKRVDAIENPPDDMEEDDWVNVRN